MLFPLRCQALLFDLDGTLIDSIKAVDHAWTIFALHHGLEPREVLPQIHGRRSIDSVRQLLPDADPEKEDAYIRHLEATYTEGVVPLPGTLELLASLPQSRWAIVTSGTSEVANARLAVTKLPAAGAYVYAEDVLHGKPAPDPYLAAAAKLGFEPKECVGFEDALPGMISIEAAGMRAIGINVRGKASINSMQDIRVGFDGRELSVDRN